MANVYKDSSGKWISQIQIGYYENGRPKFKRFKADTKKAALEKVESYKIETNNLSVLPEDADVLVHEYIRQYIDAYKSNSLKPSSLTRNYNILENQIKPTIGGYGLNQLTTTTIQKQMINVLVDKNYSYSTIHKAYVLLNEALNKAVQEERILKNVCNGVQMPVKKAFEEKEIRILTDEEARLLIEVANSKRYENGLAIVLILYTGLRCGELCALQWDDIDFEAKVMTVRRNISVHTERTEDGLKRIVELQNGTKTKLMRKVPLNEKAIDILNRIRQTSKSKFIIKTRSKVPDVTIVSQTYNNMIKYAGIKDKNGIHTLRHTFASALLKKGTDIKIVSEVLGHSSVSFTYNTYIHLSQSQKTDALSSLDY